MNSERTFFLIVMVVILTIGGANTTQAQNSLSDTLYIRKPIFGGLHFYQNGKRLSFRKAFKLCREYQETKTHIKQFRQIRLLGIPQGLGIGVSFAFGSMGFGVKETGTASVLRGVLLGSSIVMMIDAFYLNRIAVHDLHTIAEIYNKRLREGK